MMNRLLYRLRYKIWVWCEIVELYLKIHFLHKEKMIFLFGSPFHANMGDQAQTYCILKWFQDNYPDYGVLIFRYTTSKVFLLKLLKRKIRFNDILVCHSGYHLTDLYNEKDIYLKVIELFPEYPITIFPQTIGFLDEKKIQEVATIFKNHGKVTLMCRDEFSYNLANSFFMNTNLLLFPDIVTSLIGTRQYNYQRNGILFCMRNDIEAYYKPEQIGILKKRLEQTMKVDMTDTTIRDSFIKILNHRKDILDDILKKYAQYRIVVTDRYHGTIFSLIAGTPVIVIASADHKLSSGVKWFPDNFSQYIYFSDNLDEVYEKVGEILSKELSYKLPPYFKNIYYDHLNEKINLIRKM